MTFIELVEAVAQATGKPKKDVKKVLYAAFYRIDSWVRTDKVRVVVPGFGRFDPRRTRAGKAFGREVIRRDTVKFTPSEQPRMQEFQMIEKLGVVLDDSMTKTGAVGSLCPKCGGKLEEPKKCQFCGTEPFEKKPEPPQSKK